MTDEESSAQRWENEGGRGRIGSAMSTAINYEPKNSKSGGLLVIARGTARTFAPYNKGRMVKMAEQRGVKRLAILEKCR